MTDFLDICGTVTSNLPLLTRGRSPQEEKIGFVVVFRTTVYKKRRSLWKFKSFQQQLFFHKSQSSCLTETGFPCSSRCSSYHFEQVTKILFILFFPIIFLDSLINLFPIYIVVRSNIKFSIKNLHHLVMIKPAKLVLDVTN